MTRKAVRAHFLLEVSRRGVMATDLTCLLRHQSLFQGLGDYFIARIASQVNAIYARKHETLVRRGDDCTGFFVITYGRVRLSLFSAKGVERPIQIAGPGGSFGEATMFQDTASYATTAIAVEDSGLIFVPKAVVSALLKADWRLGERMLANLSQHVRLLVDDIDDFLLQAPARRLVNYLIRMVPAKAGKQSVITLTLKKNLIAAQLNLTPETLSRYFRELCDRGLIAVDGNRVTIMDVEALDRYDEAVPLDGPGHRPRRKCA